MGHLDKGKILIPIRMYIRNWGGGGKGHLLKGDRFVGVYDTYVHRTSIISHPQK